MLGRRLIVPVVVAILAAAAACSGCGDDAEDEASGGLPQGSERVMLDPADFTTKIDKPYWPMAVGNTWVYRETDTGGGRAKVVVRVTDRTKKIANGITARVIRDTVTERGVPVEITDDWYAQDDRGNIWYLGEYVTNYRDGKVVDHAGSFEAGVDGAQAGIGDLVPTEPKVQELKYARGVGPLLSIHTDGDGGRAELLAFLKRR